MGRYYQVFIYLFLTLLTCQFFCRHIFSCAKEIEATNEWTLLGENDTIAAGMHVRMDLSTGEKWVKLPEDESKPETGTSTASTTGSQVQLQVTNDGTTTVTTSKEGESTKPEEIRQQYDFDMIHRTLSKLPPEEKERMGGIPELPGNTVTSLTPEQREIFEARMKQIWEQQQEELRQFEEEFVADLPQVLKDRIARIRDYLEDPYSQLSTINLDDDPDDLTHIVAVLQDLEFQLIDVDMTRDFYTLGGWPLLVSLLSDTVHLASNETLTDGLLEKIHVIQTHAAWALGTAVKNTGEFAPYAVEEVLIGETKLTVIDLLLQQLEQTPAEGHVLQQKLQKILYSLGALLRGNRAAQVHLSASSGPDLLAKRLAVWIGEGSSGSIKLSKRLLLLASDIVTDVKLHGSKSAQVDQAIVESFSSESWCASTHRALKETSLQVTALLTVKTLAPECSWDNESVRRAVEDIKKNWESNGSGMDSDIQRERLNLVQNTLDELKGS